MRVSREKKNSICGGAGVDFVAGRWSKEEVSFLKKNMKVMSRTEIANRLNREYFSVCAKIRSLNLSEISQWTKEDLNYLMDNWENKTNEYLAKKFKRSVESVKRKACLLGLGAKREWYTTDEVVDILGLSNRSIVRYYIKKGLMQVNKVPYQNKTVYSINEEQIKRFARDNQDKWRTDKAHVLMAMYERHPSWLTKKIESDKVAASNKNMPWSDEDDRLLQEMYSELNLSQKVICEKLGRTLDSVLSREKLLFLNRGKDYVR